MGKVYDDHEKSKHGPWGTIKAGHHGPYGNKDNQHQATTEFQGEKRAEAVDKPERQK